MVTKVCPICGNEFMPHKFNPKQKCCSHKCAMINWNKNNPGHLSKCSREWAKKHRERCNKNSYRWRKKHPEMTRAYNYVQQHKIPFAKHCMWPNCCSTECLERHHSDYSRPGVVATLCRKHHKLLHANKIKFEEEFRKKVEGLKQ